MRVKRSLFSLLVLAAALAFTATQPAFADKFYTRTATSGKAQWIDAYYGWNNDCSFQTIDVDVVSGPSHGRVSPKVQVRRITQAQVGSTGRCLGKKTRAVAVYYTAKSGYSGSDQFRVRMKVRGQAPVYFVYQINVR